MTKSLDPESNSMVGFISLYQWGITTSEHVFPSTEEKVALKKKIIVLTFGSFQPIGGGGLVAKLCPTVLRFHKL